MRKPRVLKLSSRERWWLLETTVVGMVCATVAQRLIKALYRAVRKESPASVFDPDSARFSWPNLVLWAATAGVSLALAKVASARIARLGWELATGTPPPGVADRSRPD